VFLCVGVVGVFFELFVFFGGVYVVYCCLLSGAVLVWLLLFYFCWGSTTAICVALLVVL